MKEGEPYMNHENTNWGQSVAGIVIHKNKVLLARHTYGNGNGMLIIPGGYVEFGETPEAALKREVFEETNVTVEPREIIGVRFNMHDWYIVFRADYISGEAKSDHEENSEVVWMDIAQVLEREDVPQLTKILLQSASQGGSALTPHPYEGSTKHVPYSLWCL